MASKDMKSSASKSAKIHRPINQNRPAKIHRPINLAKPAK